MTATAGLIPSRGGRDLREQPGRRPVEAYGPIMDAEDELATAVAGREHCKRDGHAAVCIPPGAAATVRVLPRAAATCRNRFLA
jgi:hypothetical protein